MKKKSVAMKANQRVASLVSGRFPCVMFFFVRS